MEIILTLLYVLNPSPVVDYYLPYTTPYLPPTTDDAVPRTVSTASPPSQTPSSTNISVPPLLHWLSQQGSSTLHFKQGAYHVGHDSLCTIKIQRFRQLSREPDILVAAHDVLLATELILRGCRQDGWGRKGRGGEVEMEHLTLLNGLRVELRWMRYPPGRPGILRSWGCWEWECGRWFSIWITATTIPRRHTQTKMLRRIPPLSLLSVPSPPNIPLQQDNHHLLPQPTGNILPAL